MEIKLTAGWNRCAVDVVTVDTLCVGVVTMEMLRMDVVTMEMLRMDAPDLIPIYAPSKLRLYNYP